MTRAAGFDGLLPSVVGGAAPTPELIREMVSWIAERRGSLDGFDIVVEGTTSPGDASEPERYADAGATWWIESNWETFDPAAARLRIDAGPPVGAR